MDNAISEGIWRRLKRDRDIGRKAVLLSDVKTAFTLTPALNARADWLVKLRISCIIIQQIVTLSKYGHDALDICHP